MNLRASCNSCGEIRVTQTRNRSNSPKILEIDGVTYHPIDIRNISRSSMEVEVEINDSGKKVDGLMVAGMVGTSSEDVVMEGGETITAGQLAPLPAWWMYIVSEDTSPPVNAWDAFMKEMEAGGAST
jgi:hypothetical protein